MNHLILEQCKKLKDMGFPQDTYFGWLDVSSLWPNKSPQVATITEGVEEYLVASSPTLDELINWLGNGFNKLMVMYGEQQERIGFVAYAPNNDYGSAKTPLEAVYFLILAIKEQS